jgi:competence protein ComEA
MHEARLDSAALLVAIALLAASWPAPAPAPEPCARPAEHAADEGHTRVVSCTGPGPPLRGPARLLFGLPLDANVADARSLEALPGIGPARAEAIVRARAQARFASLADLLRVPGIGPVTLSRVAPHLVVHAATLQQNR